MITGVGSVDHVHLDFYFCSRNALLVKKIFEILLMVISLDQRNIFKKFGPDSFERNLLNTLGVSITHGYQYYQILSENGVKHVIIPIFYQFREKNTKLITT